MKKTIMIFALVLMMASSAWAGYDHKCPVWDWSQEKRQSEDYLARGFGMLTDGVYRVIKSPFKLVYHTFSTMANDEYHALNPIGVVSGLGHGAVAAGDSIITGAANIVGSIIPGANGIDGVVRSEMK